MGKQLTRAFLSPSDNFLEQLYAIRVRCARDDAILEESVTKKESSSLYLHHHGKDKWLAVECIEDISFGNVTDDSPDVYPVCDRAFMAGKRSRNVFV